MTILIKPTTSKVTSKSFSPFADNTTGLTCSDLLTGETLTLQVWFEAKVTGTFTAVSGSNVLTLVSGSASVKQVISGDNIPDGTILNSISPYIMSSNATANGTCYAVGDWADVKVNDLTFECSDKDNLMSFADDSDTYRVVKSITANPIGVAFRQITKLG